MTEAEYTRRVASVTCILIYITLDVLTLVDKPRVVYISLVVNTILKEASVLAKDCCRINGELRLSPSIRILIMTRFFNLGRQVFYEIVLWQTLCLKGCCSIQYTAITPENFAPCIQKQQNKWEKKTYVAVLIDDILLITHLYLVKNHMNNSYILFIDCFERTYK